MAFVALVISTVACGLALWCAREVSGLKQRWARLYGLRSAMVETETTLQELMEELDESGRVLIAEIDHRFARTADPPEPDGCMTLSDHAPQPSTPKAKGPTRLGRVVDLACQGYTVEAIANELDMPRGEVKLILDLEQFRH